MNSYKIRKLIEILKPYTKHVDKPKEFSSNVNNMWKCLVEQICVRGGSAPINALEECGCKDRFLSQLSLDRMPLSYEDVLKVVICFNATRFYRNASMTIVKNYERSFSNKAFKFVSLFIETYPKKELSKERIEAERRVRNELRRQQAFVWKSHKKGVWSLSYWKNKPISDWLKDIGFAVTLMPFDTRVKRILDELKIRVTERNYEDIEDMFIQRVCPKLGILPSQLDQIFYRKSNRIVDLLKS